MSTIGWFDSKNIEEEVLKELDVDLDNFEFFDRRLTEKDLEKFDKVCIAPGSEVTSEMLENFEGTIVTRSDGFDHIDLDAVPETAEIYNTPGYGPRTVAEYTFMLILSAVRKLPETLETNTRDLSLLRGSELKGKTLGVVGAGKIGKEVLKLGEGFDMDLIAFDVQKDSEAAEEIGYEYVGLEELLERSDIVSVHCPLNEATRGMISTEEFELMNDTLFVNTARSGIVDTDAMITALENRNISHACLDVTDENRREELEKIESTTITPHNAYNTFEANKRRVKKSLKALEGDGNRLD